MKETKEKSGALIDVTALRVNQQGKVLYLFSLNANTIHNLVSSGKLGVDKWSPSNQEGYQRFPTDSRFRNFGKFVAKNRGVSPPSILMSLRDRDALQLKAISGSDSVFSLKIADMDKQQLYIPDGQHRAYGLDWAVKEYPGEIENYELPVVLFVPEGKDPRYEEAQQFYLINNKSKRTKTDLAQRYVLNTREKETGEITKDITMPSSSKDILPYAVKIADMLNMDGPFKGRIEVPNASESDRKTTSISQTSFIESIKPLLYKASEAHWTIGKTTSIVKAFWNAVKSLCPESFDHWSGDSCLPEDPRHFRAVLATTSGIFVLNDILSRSMFLPEVANAPTAPESYKKILSKKALAEYFDDGRSGYWSSEDGAEGAASHGTSRKSFKEIADEIWEVIAEGQSS